jgi:methionyl-tRNA formyltransferase
MRIAILCSSETHPINSYLAEWISSQQHRHEIALMRKKSELIEGDLLFLISCSEIISEPERSKFSKSLVIHASDLPSGRGWSPHIWQILEGATEITVTLLEAEDSVDSGAIWCKQNVTVPKNFLWDEVNEVIFKAELDLMDFAVENFGKINPLAQPDEVEPTYHRRRTPEDSEIDPQKSVADQFDLIRVCDPDRFPAYFHLHGQKYTLRLEKA